jgi:hypothetical protein
MILSKKCALFILSCIQVHKRVAKLHAPLRRRSKMLARRWLDPSAIFLSRPPPATARTGHALPSVEAVHLSFQLREKRGFVANARA